MEILWILGGVGLVLLGVVRMVDGGRAWLGGHPGVYVGRQFERGGMFVVLGAVMVVAAWNVWGYG